MPSSLPFSFVYPCFYVLHMWLAGWLAGKGNKVLIHQLFGGGGGCRLPHVLFFIKSRTKKKRQSAAEAASGEKGKGEGERGKRAEFFPE